MAGSTLNLRNPHSALAALRARPQDVLEVRLPPGGEPSAGWDRVAQHARELRVRVASASGGGGGGHAGAGHGGAAGGGRRGGGAPGGGGNRSGGPGGDGRTGGAEALVREREGLSIEELLDRKAGDEHGLWIALDNLQDPHNVGAIFRASAFFGVRGIVVTQERSAPLSGTVYDVASGGLEHVPFAVVANLQRAFEKAKEAGLWILGTSEHAHDDVAKVERDRPWLLVLGNEEKGMRRLTEESCDVLCKIAPKGEGVTSLNVSVAAGIFISRLA